jgi:hypothetical protein
MFTALLLFRHLLKELRGKQFPVSLNENAFPFIGPVYEREVPEMKLLLITKHNPRSQAFEIFIIIYYETNRFELRIIVLLHVSPNVAV